MNCKFKSFFSCLFLIIICGTLALSVGCSKKPKETNTVTLWHWMNDRHDTLEELALQYQEKTGVTIKIELFSPPNTYSQKITSSAQAKILPDIYGLLDTKKTFADYIKYGYVADLTADYEANEGEWENSLFKKAVDANRFGNDNIYGVNPGIYGVPIDLLNIQMLYNKKLLKKAGVDRPPVTFDEFLDTVDALNRVGVSGLVSGWGEVWMIDCFASNYAFNIMGEEKVMATFRGEVPYTDPDWIKVLSIFKTLTDRKALSVGVVTKPNKDAEQSFALERSAFAFNGSWGVNVYHKMNPDLEYGVMLPPAINPELPMKIWGTGSSLVVNAASPQKDKAIAFLKWLTSKDQQAYFSTQTKNLPANKDALSAIPTALSEFARVMDYTTHPTIWLLDENPKVKEKYLKGIQNIIIAKKTPEQVAQEVQEVKLRELEREKRRAN